MISMGCSDVVCWWGKVYVLAGPDGAGGCKEGGLTLQEAVHGLAGTLPASDCSEIGGKRCFKK